MRISDWSSDVCSSDLLPGDLLPQGVHVVGDVGDTRGVGDAVASLRELVSGDASEAGDDEDQSREGSDQLDRDTGIVDDLHSTLRLSQTDRKRTSLNYSH